jgi:hypothetical protein
MSVKNKQHRIEKNIADLHISVPPESTQCDGDGVDSIPWCDYKFATDMKIIQNALLAANYHEVSHVSFAGRTESTYAGSDPKITFKVSSSSGIISLYGENAN